jgi:hypothetical protein
VIFCRHAGDGCRSVAAFSACGAYRYRLRRCWDAGRPRLVAVMLNPSTADERANDPTVARVAARARAMGFGGFEVVNLFALRSTDPRALARAADPVGPGNDAAILAAARGAGLVLCAWGVHGALAGRGAAVEAMLRAGGHALHHLGLTRAGLPRHPLYLAGDAAVLPWPACGDLRGAAGGRTLRRRGVAAGGKADADDTRFLAPPPAR